MSRYDRRTDPDFPPTCEAPSTRDIANVASDVLRCAVTWAPEVRVVGNVRADEIARLAVGVLSLRTENASLLARAEQAERERDEAREERRTWLLGYCEFERAFCDVLGGEGVEGNVPPADARELLWKLRADRDAWKAKAEARPEISPEDASKWLTQRMDADGPSDGWNRVVLALREHAGKVTR